MATVHGGLDALELRAVGLRADQVLDFSASINPLGPSPAVLEALKSVDVSAYPDRHCLDLRDALAARTGVEPDRILPANGSTELIHLIARALLSPAERCLIFAPTFGEYEAAARLAGARVRLFQAQKEDGFEWSMREAERAIETLRPKIVFLCNPNNPTGVYLSRAAMERLIRALGTSGLLVLDEAYAPLADDHWDALPLLRQGNVALLRSMTKDHALPGVRLGYLIGPAQVVANVRRYQPPWSVSAIAQAAGLAALESEGHIVRGRRVVQEAKRYLLRELDRLGVAARPSAANFLLAYVGDGAGIRRALLPRGICVRDCASFGLPAYIRIGVRAIEDCRRLVAALEEVLAR